MTSSSVTTDFLASSPVKSQTGDQGIMKDLKKSEMNLVGSFFQFTLSSEKMDIPRAAVLEMQGNSVILRDRYQNSWPLEVEIIGDRCCFKTGWPRFYEDNALEQHNLLVFDYRGGNLFDFQLFGNNECEKKGVGAPKFRVKEEVVEEYTTEEEDLNEEEEDNEAEEEEEEEEDDDDDDYEHEEEERVEEEQVGISKKKKSKSKSIGTSKRNLSRNCSFPVGTSPIKSKNSKSNEGVEVPMFGINTMPSRRTYQKKIDCYGADIFKAGLATRPENHPFFVSRSRTSRKNELYIPKDVILDYNLEIPEDLFLVDEKGRKWKTKVKQWKDGRLWCTSGWRRLCNVNNIDEEDICICEFVKQGCKDMHILVRVVDGAG